MFDFCRRETRVPRFIQPVSWALESMCFNTLSKKEVEKKRKEENESIEVCYIPRLLLSSLSGPSQQRKALVGCGSTPEQTTVNICRLCISHSLQSNFPRKFQSACILCCVKEKIEVRTRLQLGQMTIRRKILVSFYLNTEVEERTTSYKIIRLRKWKGWNKNKQEFRGRAIN